MSERGDFAGPFRRKRKIEREGKTRAAKEKEKDERFCSTALDEARVAPLLSREALDV